MSPDIAAEPRIEGARRAGEPAPTPESPPEKPRPAGVGRRRQRPLPLGTRVVLATLGSVLLILGIAGLFLPFLQGILFLMLAAAVLSLASDRVYGWLRGLLRDRTPSFWERVERFRTRVRWRFRSRGGADS